jgi:hypothetical protein
MRWTGVDPISTPTPGTEAQWAKVHDLLAELERERTALVDARLGFATPEPCDSSGIDPEALRRERRGVRTFANLKWMCVGSGISWVAFILMSL